MKNKQAYELEINLLNKLKDHLSAENMIKDLNLSQEERKSMSHYQFLTDKNYIVLLNTGETDEDTADCTEVINYIKEKGITCVDFCGKIEMELAQLPPEERKEFMEELGIEESARKRFIKESYKMLNLISFITVGKDEVRAWTIESGTIAQKAAGKIHSDLERGFIRAETVSYEDFKEKCNGDMNKAREQGLLRQEGKEYIVKDGDIINIKFNV
ncbi:MAG: DUF933 domain-containing protein, partial [Spirochaetota bacterium]